MYYFAPALLFLFLIALTFAKVHNSCFLFHLTKCLREHISFIWMNLEALILTQFATVYSQFWLKLSTYHHCILISSKKQAHNSYSKTELLGSIDCLSFLYQYIFLSQSLKYWHRFLLSIYYTLYSYFLTSRLLILL